MSRTARSVVQVILALLAVGAFLLLLDVLFRYSNPVAPAITSSLARDLWILLLIGTLGLLLLVELLLLGKGRDDAVATDTDGTVYLLGCTACGTVFEHQGGQGSTFRCTNCLRTGIFRGGAHVEAPVRSHTCTRCGNAFQAYHAEAECPVCHLMQPTA